MGNQVDVTLSVLIDNAVLEYEKTTNEIMNKYGISIDLAEVALEKSLMNLKNKKLSLYASAIYDMNTAKVLASGKDTIKPSEGE